MHHHSKSWHCVWGSLESSNATSATQRLSQVEFIIAWPISKFHKHFKSICKPFRKFECQQLEYSSKLILTAMQFIYFILILHIFCEVDRYHRQDKKYISIDFSGWINYGFCGEAFIPWHLSQHCPASRTRLTQLSSGHSWDVHKTFPFWGWRRNSLS